MDRRCAPHDNRLTTDATSPSHQLRSSQGFVADSGPGLVAVVADERRAKTLASTTITIGSQRFGGGGERHGPTGSSSCAIHDLFHGRR